MADRIISLDCEANGLHGQIFAAAASIQTRQHGERWASQLRIPIDEPVDQWVTDNVLPALNRMTLGGVREVPDGTGQDLASWWLDLYRPLRREGFQVVVHVGWPVEARFLWDAHAPEPFSGPFPLLDLAGLLDGAGCDPTSVEAYLADRGIPRPVGSAHHPLYDARAAALAYWDLTAGGRRPADS